MPGMAPHDLRVEGRHAPLGLTERTPLLSWRTEAPQVAYQLMVSDAADGRVLFDTGLRPGPERRVQLPDLGWQSRQRLCWQVLTWSELHAEPVGCASATWEMGLLTIDDWRARWIGFTNPSIATGAPELVFTAHPAPCLRRRFELRGPAISARLHVTALGLFELWLNGARVGRQLLAPGWTDYERRVEIRTFDVGGLLRPGANALAATITDGWFAGHIGFFGRCQYGDRPALLAQLEIEFADDVTVVVATDRRWRAATGATRAADLIMGETVDWQAEQPGWREPEFDDRAWSRAQERSWTDAVRYGRVAEDVEVVAELEPVSIHEHSDGAIIVDAGQNVSGHVEIEWEGRPGETLTLRHGEALAADGSLYTANLRTALQRDEVTPSDDGPASYAPSFTFHGFRYVELKGVERARLTRLRVKAISAALPQTGTFACSDPLLDQLQNNIVWSQRGNFVDVPTDCPQRDERLGWAGDVQTFAPTAAFNMNVEAFLTRWLEALVDAQHPTGAFPDIAPLKGWTGYGNAGWSDAGVIVPWLLHERYDNRRLLGRMYPALKRYLRFLEADSTDGLRLAGRYGEWVPLEEPTPSLLVGTAYLARSAQVMTSIASTLGYREDVARYRTTRRRVAAAFVRAFADEHGQLRAQTQSAHVLALGFGLAPAGRRAAWARRLAELIEHAGYLATGFLATPLALPVLSDHGYHEMACRLVQKDTFPSWGFTIRQGATTIWERWDGRTADGSFHESDMNSFNHYALGSVGDWLYRYLGGLRPRADGPGYRRWTVAPLPGGTIEWARTRYRSAYGDHVVEWERQGKSIHVEVGVPQGTKAELRLPGTDGLARVRTLAAGSYQFNAAVEESS
jgi:alpha-L-rhamnosidase